MKRRLRAWGLARAGEWQSLRWPGTWFVVSVPGGTPMGSLLPLGEWVRNPALRSWPVLLFISLVAVPPIALVVFVDNPSQSTFDEAAWILAAYFALAWLLLVG